MGNALRMSAHTGGRPVIMQSVDKEALLRFISNAAGMYSKVL